MANAKQPMYNYLLNTENYEPVFRASKKITELVRENDAIIARLNDLVDLNFRLPQPHDIADTEGREEQISNRSNGQKNSSENGDDSDFVDDKAPHILQPERNPGSDVYSDNYEEITRARKEPSEDEDEDMDKDTKSGEDANSSSEGANTRTNKFGRSSSDVRDVRSTGDPEDYLRNYLDQVVGVGAVPCNQFERVQNSRVRQLLIDNYRLQQIRDQKQDANRQLLGIHTKYQQLLKEVAIPRLSQDVYKHRIKQCEAERQAVEESFSQTDSLWKAYTEYLELLEEIRGVAEKLVDLVAKDVDDNAMARLHMQLDIIVRLKQQLDNSSLTCISRSAWDPFA